LDEEKRWAIFTFCSSLIITLTIMVIAVFAPLYVQILGGIIGSISVVAWIYGMFQGDYRRLRFSLGLIASLFVLSLLDQIWTRTIANKFPIQLLGFLLILFNVETMALATSHRKLHLNQYLSRGQDLARASWKIIWSKIAALGILFSGCYLLTISTIYIGLSVYPLAPVMGDTSIYLIAVFVILALFITLKEGSPNDHEVNRDLGRG